MNHPQIAAFARTAEENSIPLRKLEGQRTRLGRTVHDLSFDPIHDEIIVSSPFAQAILSFRGGAAGEEPPIRIIQGPRTQIVSNDGMDKVTVDPVNNEILVWTSLNQVLVFPRDANGDVAPIRVLSGPDTKLDGGRRPSMRVDAKNNLLFVANRSEILIFDRTASGNTPPKATIPGPSNIWQFEVYNDMVIFPRGENIVAWSIHSTGPGARPLLSIPAPLGERAAQIGIALNPKHKEVLMGTGQGNQVRTYYVPELFETSGAVTTSASRGDAR